MYASLCSDYIDAYDDNPSDLALTIRQHLFDGAEDILGNDVAPGRVNAYNAIQNAVDKLLEGVVDEDQDFLSCSVTFNDVDVQNNSNIVAKFFNEFHATGTLEIPVGSELLIAPE